MEEKYQLEEGILLSHFLKFTQSGVETSEGVWDSDETLMENLFEDDEDHNLDRPTEEMERKKSFRTETAKPINVLVPRSKFPKAGAAVSTVARERECVAVYGVWEKLHSSCTGRNDVWELCFGKKKLVCVENNNSKSHIKDSSGQE